VLLKATGALLCLGNQHCCYYILDTKQT